MENHEIQCRHCGSSETVSYETAKRAERGEVTHDWDDCGGTFRRVWDATPHVWGQNTGRERGLDLGSV